MRLVAGWPRSKSGTGARWSREQNTRIRAAIPVGRPGRGAARRPARSHSYALVYPRPSRHRRSPVRDLRQPRGARLQSLGRTAPAALPRAFSSARALARLFGGRPRYGRCRGLPTLARACGGNQTMSPDDHAHDNSHGHPHASIEDAPLGYYARMQEAVQELLIESGVLTADEIRRAVEAMDERSPAQGARVIARAWTDPVFKARLLADGTAACRELGIEIGPTRL